MAQLAAREQRLGCLMNSSNDKSLSAHSKMAAAICVEGGKRWLEDGKDGKSGSIRVVRQLQ
jgi:hypothetical protein